MARPRFPLDLPRHMKIVCNIAAFTCIYLLLAGCAIGVSWPTAKVDVVVVDEDGNPVEGADVVIGFSQPGFEPRTEGVHGLSDIDGRFSARKITTGTIFYGAKKEGYYRSHYEKQIGIYSPGLQRFDPVEFQIVMRKIVNPVPMYGRDLYFKPIIVPVLGIKVGFDLIAFDWVAPYGKGVNSDFIFKIDKKVVSYKNFWSSFVVNFQNDNDGIIIYRENDDDGSEMKLPRFAPSEGYVREFVFEESKAGSGVKRNFDFLNDSVNYIFRIRSITQKDGSVKSMYGKIIGPIRFDQLSVDTATISFKYYLNPDYTRNLEYDPERNLFGILPPSEQVGLK